jgi:phage shock protein E
MGLLDFFKGPDINQGIKEFENTPNAILIDVRTPEEYSQGRIPGSKNIPLNQINKIQTVAKKSNIPLFVYCLSGARSRQAVSYLKSLGYTSVTNLGGISSYTGRVIR